MHLAPAGITASFFISPITFCYHNIHYYALDFFLLLNSVRHELILSLFCSRLLFFFFFALMLLYVSLCLLFISSLFCLSLSCCLSNIYLCYVRNILFEVVVFHILCSYLSLPFLLHSSLFSS